jgi:hypothetical protein
MTVDVFGVPRFLGVSTGCGIAGRSAPVTRTSVRSVTTSDKAIGPDPTPQPDASSGRTEQDGLEQDDGIREVALPLITSIQEAVYWPGEGYGCANDYETIQQACAAARRSIAMGYGKAGKNPIRVIVTTTQIIEITGASHKG